MTSGRFALEQVRRFRVTNYFAMLDESGIAELARVLAFAHTDIIAVAVVNEWLEAQTDRPTPADIRRLVTMHNDSHKARLIAAQPKPPLSQEEKDFLAWRKGTHGW
jgi:hypothetical protein